MVEYETSGGGTHRFAAAHVFKEPIRPAAWARVRGKTLFSLHHSAALAALEEVSDAVKLGIGQRIVRGKGFHDCLRG